VVIVGVGVVVVLVKPKSPASVLSAMKKNPEPDDRPEKKPSRTEEARQVVQEHIDDQRATLEKLRRKMN